MNQLKPYLFWVVIGSVLLLELAWWLLSIPDIDLVGNKAGAQKVKQTLDTEYKHLEELDKRAKKGSPTGVFDAEKESDIRNLTDSYLITPAWKEVLAPHVKRYDEQLVAIKQHLAARSVNLRKPIADSSDKFAWYTAYQNTTETQLKRLADANALILPAAAGARATGKPNKPVAVMPPGAAMPPGVPGPGPLTAAPPVAPAAGVTPSTGPDFATDATLRAIAGFFTKGADLPDPTQHDLLTRQFRTMERIITVVLGTSATDKPNPLAAVEDAPAANHAAIAGVTWDTQANGAMIGGDAGTYATGWRMTLTLQGPLSAILSAVAALEHPHEATSPLMVVFGAEVSRKASFVSGERKDTGSEAVAVRIDLLVMDFTDAPNGVRPAVSALPATVPAAGMPPGFNGQGGMPPGFNGQGGMPPNRPPGGLARPPSANADQGSDQ